MDLNDTIKIMSPQRSTMNDLTRSPFKYLKLRWTKSSFCYIPQLRMIYYDSLPFGCIILCDTQYPRRKSNFSSSSLNSLLTGVTKFSYAEKVLII